MLERRCRAKEGNSVRPFSLSAGVKCRGYSCLLQRALTDLASDDSFGKASEKLKEHYGVSVPESSIRQMTLTHCQAMQEDEVLFPDPPKHPHETIIEETDGSMVPIVETDNEDGADRRRTRRTKYKEARLTLAHPHGNKSPVFAATFASVDKVGEQMLGCAKSCGLTETTKVHFISDGAAWIHGQADRIFGTQVYHLLDFYHACEYIAGASKICAPEEPNIWLKIQSSNLLRDELETILDSLRPYLEEPIHDENESNESSRLQEEDVSDAQCSIEDNGESKACALKVHREWLKIQSFNLKNELEPALDSSSPQDRVDRSDQFFESSTLQVEESIGGFLGAALKACVPKAPTKQPESQSSSLLQDELEPALDSSCSQLETRDYEKSDSDIAPELQGEEHIGGVQRASELLAAVPKARVPKAPIEWLESQSSNLSKRESVLAWLFPYIEERSYGEQSEASKPKGKPVYACYRYLNNHRTQMQYKECIDKNLPIGSGEIESAHRSIIQARLKIPGAWWLLENAEKMLQLRCVRVNGQWNKYWSRYENNDLLLAA